MDFKKFRLGGELSDVQVIVDGQSFQLHRFPLYTRSDYFLKAFAKMGTQQVVTLEDFPGGADSFTVIADYCYNISVHIDVMNVIGLRCGAKHLEMYGSGNLYEKTGVLIEEIANNARRGRDLVKLLQLISTIPQYKSDETTSHTLEQCLSALVYHWNKCQYGTTSLYEVTTPEVQVVLFGMDFQFFVKLIKACKERTENDEVINVLISEYILHILDNDSTATAKATIPDEHTKLENGEANGEHDMDEGIADGDEEGHSSPEGEANGVEKDQDIAVENSQESSKPQIAFSESSLKMIQTLLSEIKPNLSLSKHTAAKWLKPLLEAYSQVDGSDEMLGSIAASMANQMDEECMSTMTEETLVAFSERVDGESLSDGTQSLIVKQLIRHADADKLTVPGFIKISQALPLHQISSHDGLLHIIAKLNTSTDGSKFSDEELKDCLSRVDMKKCSVKGLREAASSGGIPSDIIANAALDLCDGLQEKLDSTSKIIQAQEKEISNLSIQTFGALRIDTSPPRRTVSKGLSSSHSTLYSSAPRIELNSPRSLESPTAGLGRVIDGIWAEHERGSPPNLYEANSKLSELLRKQRQNRMK